MVLMQKPSVTDSPSGRSPEKAPRWDLMGTEGCGGGNRVSWCSWMFSGYMSIYKRRKSVRGATRGPRGWGVRPPASWLPRVFLDIHTLLGKRLASGAPVLDINGLYYTLLSPSLRRISAPIQFAIVLGVLGTQEISCIWLQGCLRETIFILHLHGLINLRSST